VPLYGRRLSRHWRFTAGSRTAVMGNRGPRDGIDDPSSYTYGRDGRWAGHVVFGDGHVEFLESFVPPGMLDGSGSERLQDNLFAMEEGASGGDAILTFTRIMEHDGPVIQHD
jgi:prepilin-type processing-associated H-X9-DG protein